MKACLVLFLYLPMVVLAGEPRTYHEQGLEFVAQIKETLISYGYCANVSECSKKDSVFLTNKEDGFLVSVYGVHNKVVTSELVDKLYLFYSKQHKNISLSLEVYSSKYSEVSKIYFLKKPDFRIRLPAYVEANE